MMIRNTLDEDQKAEIRERLNFIWEIGEHYWYPLSKCDRTDLIAFDSKYIIRGKKLSTIKRILLEYGVNRLYEYREDGKAYVIQGLNDYDFWDSDDYFWNNEGFWFDDTMKWIIYISHEEIISFGGELILHRLKREWPDWHKHLKWDTKN